MKKPCKPGKTPTGKNGRCVKQKTCKAGKTPTGKNGRCVKSKTQKTRKQKICKEGKTPTGKNGRCVKSKTYTVKSKTPTPKTPTPKTPTPKTPSVKYVNGRPFIKNKEALVRKQINDYMDLVGDDEWFSKSEIEHIVKVAVDRNLTEKEIEEGLNQFHKSYGVFY